MPRRPRSDLPDGVYHVTAQGIYEHLLFVDDEDRRRFLWLLGQTTTRHAVRCLAYCLMGTHYHLVLEGTSAELASAMRHLNGRYAQQLNERHSRSGHVFAQRYSAFIIRDDRHLADALAYISANPVKAGLCETGEDWPWTWIADAASNAVPVPATRVE